MDLVCLRHRSPESPKPDWRSTLTFITQDPLSKMINKTNQFHELSLERCAGPYGGPSLKILIDGIDLIERVRVVEAPYDEKVAGKYASPPTRVLPPCQLFFGVIPDGFGWVSCATIEGTVPILGCTCGTEGCWPLHVAIEVNEAENTVEWTGFINPFRRNWTYLGLGPFLFRLDQYQQAIEGAIQ